MIIRRKKTGGRVADEVMEAYALRYRLTQKQRVLVKRWVVQLSLCTSDEARRLLLGVSR